MCVAELLKSGMEGSHIVDTVGGILKTKPLLLSEMFHFGTVNRGLQNDQILPLYSQKVMFSDKCVS